MTTSTRFSHRIAVQQKDIEGAQTSVILAGKTWYRRHFTTRLCKNVVGSKQVKYTVSALAFFVQQKAAVTSNTNNGATYAADKE